VWIGVHLVLAAACLGLAAVLLFRPGWFFAFQAGRGRNMSGYPTRLIGIVLGVIGLTQIVEALR
jgi:hypothetical protein